VFEPPVSSVVSRVEVQAGETGSVGIGIPGSLDPVTGLAKGASSTWLNGKPVEADLRRTLGREIRVVNDADCFVVSEAVDGAAAGHNVVFAVILGSGAGAGVAVGGKAHHGPNNSAGEWGHNALPRPDVTEIPGPACYCGRHGCLERWVSGWSFARDYHQHASIDLAASEPLAPAEIVVRMREGDRLARLVWRRYVDRVARGLSVVINTLDPDIVVLGGGMANIDELYDELPARLAEETFSPCFYTPIVRAMHGDSSGVRGAAWLWR
jgi:fructokinase